MKKPIPGTSVVVTIDGVDYTTIIDSDGRQRFPKNRIVSFIFNSSTVDMNMLSDMLDNEMITLNELMAFYMSIGYSVSGFADTFDNCKIANPLWED